MHKKGAVDYVVDCDALDTVHRVKRLSVDVCGEEVLDYFNTEEDFNCFNHRSSLNEAMESKSDARVN